MAVDPVVQGVACGLLAWVMGSAAWHKCVHGPAFRAALESYGLLPVWLVSSAASALAGAEGAAALGLLWPGTASSAALAVTVLLTLYSGAIALSLARGRVVSDCGCGGPARERPVSVGLLVRNAVLLGVGVLGAAPLAPRPVGAFDLVTGVGAAGVAVLVYSAAERAAANARSQRDGLRRVGQVA